MKLMEIHDQYYDRVSRFIKSLVKDEWVTEDLIQETFLRVKNNIDSVRDSSKLSSWIYRISYNLCQDYFKASKKESLKECELKEDKEAFFRVNIEKQLEQQQMGSCVQRQMELLPDSLRTVLVMYEILEFTHKEITEILEITEENSKVRLHRARKSFKKILDAKCTFETDERNVLVCEPVK